MLSIPMLIFLLLLLLLQNICSPVYLKQKKLIFFQLYKSASQCSASSPDHHKRRKISGTPLGTPRITMFPMVHIAIYKAGFQLLLFWRTLILCWLAQKYLAIGPCLCRNIFWIRIQSLYAAYLLNYAVTETLFCSQSLLTET